MVIAPGCVCAIMDFLLPASFQACFSLNIFEQAVGPDVLQTFSLWAVKLQLDYGIDYPIQLLILTPQNHSVDQLLIS